MSLYRRGRTRLGRPAGATSLGRLWGPAPSFGPGLCAGSENADIWTDDLMDRSGTPTVNAEAAVRICNRCPFRAECLTWAIDHRERYGIWGGLTPGERRDQVRVREVLAA